LASLLHYVHQLVTNFCSSFVAGQVVNSVFLEIPCQKQLSAAEIMLMTAVRMSKNSVHAVVHAGNEKQSAER